MSDEGEIKFTVGGLEKLLKALKAEPPVARVGIIGATVARAPEPGEKSSLNNAELGAIYEFNDGGNPNRPGGSFLRVPIADKLPEAMRANRMLSQRTTQKVIESGTVVPWLQQVAATAHAVVMGAFATGGYGKWKPSNMKYKSNHQTLVETTRLRESVIWEVKEK